MTSIRRILYATDLSPASDAAWATAQVVGRLFDAEIVVLTLVARIVSPAVEYLPPRIIDEALAAADRTAREGLARIIEGRVPPTLRVRSRVEGGPAADGIVDAAREEGAALIVMGTHGRTGLGRVVLGSVADRVVRLAPCPVLTVRARPDAAPTARPIQRICHATDFSPSGRAAWSWALAFAEAAGAEIDLLHVTTHAVPDRYLSPEVVARMAQGLRQEAEARAEEFVRQAPLGRERIHVVIPSGDPGVEIVTWAQARDADLIVMGTHGRSGLARWMLGSVAHHVVPSAPCPVVTVGPEVWAATAREARP